MAYDYDRQGRQTTITQGGSVVTGRAYTLGGLLLSESYSGGPLNGLAMTNGYDHYLRRTNVTLLAPGSQLLATTTNSFDIAGRMKTVGSGAATATYSYLADSALEEQISFANNGAGVMNTVKSYDALNRLTNIVSTTNGTGLSKHGYLYNTANQRTRATLVDSSYWIFSYDNLGQVTSGKKYWSDGTPVAGQQFEYGFDTIGNRKTSASGGDELGATLRQSDYFVNALNQYASRTVPGFLDVIGTANASATVSLWGDNGSFSPTSREGDYFRGELSANNTTGAVWLTITNVAVLKSGNTDIITNTLGKTLVTKTPQAFYHDLDGNLTNDGDWVYTWDAENRLTRMVANELTGQQQRIDIAYDAQGRRTTKRVWNNTSGGGSLAADLTLVFDGWNLIAELNSTNSAVIRSYVWGLDLSGTLQGAGGVGGLLAAYDASTLNNQPSTHFACYDGNGNVMALVNAANGTISGDYIYGPFGETLRATGPMAMANPFRFSTKYQDDETGLLYYGFRYYDPSTGRWNSRDPIDEHGGENLQVFVFNDAVNFLDRLGLQCSSCPKPPPGQAAHTCPAGKLTFRRRPPKIVSVATIKSFPQQSNPPAPAITLPSYTESLKCERCSTATCGWKLVLNVDSTCETFYVDDRRVPTLHYVPSVAAMIHHENDCHCDDWEAAFTAIRDRLAGPHYSSKRDCQNAKKAINFESLLKQEIAPSKAHADPKYGMPPHQNAKAPCYATWSGTF